jgi:hypothetical protein
MGHAECYFKKTHTRAHTHTHTHTHTQTHTQTQTRTRTRAHTRTHTRAHTHTHTEPEFSPHHSNGSFWEEVGFLGQSVHTAQKMFHLDFPQAILNFFAETQCLFLNRKMSVTFLRFCLHFINTPVM